MTQKNEIEKLKNLIVATQTHLETLETQVATFGLHVPAHITTEINKYKSALAQLQAKYKTLAPGAAPDPALGRANWHLVHPYLGATEHFTGRQTEQQMLTDWLAESPAHPLLLVRALGGFGKSALTWHWLQNKVDPTKWPRVVWWSLYETNATFEQFLAETLAYLGHDPIRINPRQQVQILLRALHQPGLLLVLDGFERALRAYSGLGAAYQGDADNPEVVAAYGSGRECVSPLAVEFLRGIAAVPRLAGRVLLTSRLRPTAVETRNGLLLQGCREEELTALTPADAAAYFQANGIKGSRAELEAAGKPYGYHPLSLQLLAGVILSDFDNPGDVAAAQNLDLSGDLVQRQHHVLEQSYDRLTLPQRALLGMIACFRGPVEVVVLRQVAVDARSGGLGGPTPVDSTLSLLLTRGLLHHDPATRRFDLHPIVRRYAYDRLIDPTTTHTRLRDYFAAVEEPAKVEKLEDLIPLIEHYHHTLRAGQYDMAWELFRDRIWRTLYYQLGAYQTQIELLRGLFINGEHQLPKLEQEADQAHAMNELANSYSCNGQPRRAMQLFEIANDIYENQMANKEFLAIGLGNLANMAQLPIGLLQAAETNLRRQITLSREIEDEFWEANGQMELGRLLAYRGVWTEAVEALDTALTLCEKLDHVQSQGLTWAYRALAGLLYQRGLVLQPSGGIDDQPAKINEDSTPFILSPETAGRALELAKERKKVGRPNASDFIRAYWLLGAALRVEGALSTAETHLIEALTRCRGIDLVETEAEILLNLARLQVVQGAAEEAQRLAAEALVITERCGYVLQGADVCLFFAEQAHKAGEWETALEFAQRAKDLAYCDGPPYHYKVAFEEAEALLAVLSGG